MFLVQLKEGATTGINARGQDLSYFWERVYPSLAAYINYVYKKLFPPVYGWLSLCWVAYPYIHTDSYLGRMVYNKTRLMIITNTTEMKTAIVPPL